MIRRYCSDRVCLFMSILLLSYIGWNVFSSTKRPVPSDNDLTEELAYIKAMNTSSPMAENTQLCSLDKIDLVFLIMSSSSHFLERQSVRETWGSMPDVFGVHSQRLFVIGYRSGGDFYKDISHEAAHEQDLLYLTVNDQSMTLKEMYAYRWLDQHCPNVIYTFKTEDDLFVNSLLLHDLVRELKTTPNDTKNRGGGGGGYLNNVLIDSLFAALIVNEKSQFLFGWAYEPGRPERNRTRSPFYVSYEEYSKEMFPRYCSGFGYFMTSQTRHALTIEAFKDKHPFRFADIFLTGILPERLNFVCDIIPFNFHQGTTDQCIEIIRKSEMKDSLPTSTPLLVCSTGRHIGENAFSDYYRLWTDLKTNYADRLQPSKNESKI